MKEYNGKIDFLKFIFALFIMTLHYKWRPVLFDIGGHKIVLAQSGYYAVVFFFVVSGALFSISAYNKQSVWKEKMSASHISCDVQGFILRKYRMFIPWYLVAFSIYVVIDLFVDLVPLKKVISNIFWSVPSCLLLGYTGFDTKEIYAGGYYVGASWYIGALMVMYCLFFPIIRWSYNVFAKIISPILLIGCLYVNVSVLHIEIVSSRLYPFIPFLLGVIIGDVSIQLNNKLEYRLSRFVICNIVEILGYVLIAGFLCIDYSDMPFIEYPVLFVVGFTVLLSLLKINMHKFFDNRIFRVLGTLSMIVYMLHSPIGVACSKIINKSDIIIDNNGIYYISLLSTAIVTLSAYCISNKIKKGYN